MSAGELKPWPVGTVCPAEGYSDFAAALNLASHHYADDSGREWGAAGSCMDNAAGIAVDAAWPYWAMKRMFAEIAPLPSFDSFMPFYCKRLLANAADPTALRAQRDALLEALEGLMAHEPDYSDTLWENARALIALAQAEAGK